MDPVAVGAGAAVLTAIVAGLGVARRARKLPPAMPLSPDHRALIQVVYALGHDPAKVLFQLVQGKKKGLRILTRDGRPLRFYRPSEIERRQRTDPMFRQRFMEARRS